ncbi:T9SS type A sorting domain-containing protein [Epilithonimonas sp. UC225_85]|uniref:T9SS type A sorting domain-containing protein n=1 Tax=Epilithonimonas sp. UC225_85 TaxID=3350167 RepID=UPI0036D3D818
MQGDKFKVLITTDNGTTWQELKNWDNPNMTISNERNNITIDVSAYKNNNVKFAFYASDGTTFVAAADYRIFVDNFKVQLKQSMSVSDIKKSILQVYPNPTTGKITVNTNQAIKSMELFDFTGKKIKVTTTNQMDLSDMSAGTYLLTTIFNDKTSINKKVIKK